MARTSFLDRMLSIALTTAALALSVAVVKREFFPAPKSSGAAAIAQEVAQSEWSAVNSNSLRWGNRDAAVQIAVFADVECPFCRSLHESLKEIESKHPTSVSLSMLHFPLSIHPSAMLGAQALECADRLGGSREVLDALYESQDSLARLNWLILAEHAGLDTGTVFSRCVQSETAWARIDSGMAIGKRLGVTGTPSVLVNGWRLPYPPTRAEMDDMIDSILLSRSR